MKILILNTLYHPYVRGGAERSVQALAEALAAQNTEVVVISTVGPGSRATDVINGVKVVYVPIANLYWPFDWVDRSPLQRKLWHIIDAYNPAMKAAVMRLIRQEQPSVIHTNNLQGLSIAAWHAARAARIPILHTLRDYYLTCARCSRYRNGRDCERTCWDCLPFLLARRQASACVAAVVGLSHSMLDHHHELGFFANASFKAVIHNAYPPISVARRTSSAALPFTFGYLGRLTPEKGIELLLDTFAARRDGGWGLLVAGEGTDSYCQWLHQQHAKLENRDAIRFLGWVDPAEFFTKVDILVVPSLWQEPLSRVILEAFAHGVPVIGSRRGGIPEQIEDGITGLLFDPDDPTALGTVIDRVLQDRTLSERLGQNALSRAREQAPERVSHKYREAYLAVLEAARE
jgi:glycosyltransferase involved in cell wall biosynthesis